MFPELRLSVTVADERTEVDRRSVCELLLDLLEQLLVIVRLHLEPSDLLQGGDHILAP